VRNSFWLVKVGSCKCRYPALLSSSYFERINDDDDDDESKVATALKGTPQLAESKNVSFYVVVFKRKHFFQLTKFLIRTKFSNEL